MGKYKISCDEATTICDKNQYGEASFVEKLKLMIHFYGCKVCKCYSDQNNLMTKIYNKYSKDKSEQHTCFSKDEKKKLEKKIKEKME